MRELNLNGYIDDELWFGDEITPETLHESLFGADNKYTDDVHIRLNSYGGACNAAVRMFDDIRAYPGSVASPCPARLRPLQPCSAWQRTGWKSRPDRSS